MNRPFNPLNVGEFHVGNSKWRYTLLMVTHAEAEFFGYMKGHVLKKNQCFLLRPEDLKILHLCRVNWSQQGEQ